MFAPVATGKFRACLPYSGFTRPPVVAAAPLRSNPLLSWIRGDSIPAPGAVERSRLVRVFKCPVNPARLIPNSEATVFKSKGKLGGSLPVKQMKFRREFIRAKAAGSSPPKSPANSFTEDHGRRRMSSKLQSRTSGLPRVSSTRCCSESKEISR